MGLGTAHVDVQALAAALGLGGTQSEGLVLVRLRAHWLLAVFRPGEGASDEVSALLFPLPVLTPAAGPCLKDMCCEVAEETLFISANSLTVLGQTGLPRPRFDCFSWDACSRDLL